MEGGAHITTSSPNQQQRDRQADRKRVKKEKESTPSMTELNTFESKLSSFANPRFESLF